MRETRSFDGQLVKPFVRIVLSVVVILAFIAGIQLYILSDQTGLYFAWTINLPLTAAFLGAGYWAALVSAALSLRQAQWLRVRSSFLAAFTSTALLLIATLLHLDKFHLSSPEPITRLAAWVWVIVYVVVPPALIVGYIAQLRAPGENPPAQNNLPRWIRVLLGVQGAAVIVTGLALFLLPQEMTPWWAWALTPLTARALGAWFIAFGIAGVVVAWENDQARVLAAVAGLAAFGVLQMIAVLRYIGSIDWSKASAWLYLLFLLSVLVSSGYILFASRQTALQGRATMMGK